MKGSPTRRAAASCDRTGLAPRLPGPRTAACRMRRARRSAAALLDGPRHLPRPVPERRPVRPAAVPGRQRPDADLRDHGRDQPRARQLLHARRLPGVWLAPWFAAHLGGSFFAALAIGVVLAVVFGYLLEWAFFSYLYQRDHLQQVLLTYGADPRLRGAAQHPGRQRRARRARRRLARRQRSLGS